jgi:tetratricopeptide (TPR) repeat protein
MRSAVILSFFCIALSLFATAETIVLKNGRKIVVDSVREENGKVYYEIGDSSYAIPKSAVDHIDSFGSAAPLTTAPDFIPKTTLPESAETVNVDVIHNGRVDDSAIGAAEASGDPARAAAANYLAGRFSLEQGDRDGAARYFDRALRFKPDDMAVLVNDAAVLVRMGRIQEGIPVAERATRVDPDSPDAWAVLGYALLQSDHAREAVPALEKAEALHSDSTIEQYLALARRESKASANFIVAESSHFSLRFEGKAVRSTLPQSILEALDSDYDALVSQLDYAPHETIPVILYPDHAYFDVTLAPSWSSAVNDGKIQLPVHGMTAVTPDLARVLRHELTHSFVNQITRGRCPLWLNEGVAQLMESRTVGSTGRLLGHLFGTEHEVPLNSLEGSFLNLDTNAAAIAYAESLAALEYINDTYGMSDIRRLLGRIGEGASTESALRSTFNVGYGQFEQDIATFLRNKYGN